MRVVRSHRTGLLRSALAFLLLIAGCAVGCGGSSAPAGETGTDAPARTETVAAEPQPAADRTDERPVRSTGRSPLGRHDAPPAGIARLVEFHASGDSYCQDRPSPEIIFDRRGFSQPLPGMEGGFPPLDELADPEIGESLGLCFTGFAPDATITVTVTDPTGATQVRRFRTEAEFVYETTAPTVMWHWAPRPGDPLGRYRVTAEQQGAVVTSVFTLHPPSAPNIAQLATWRIEDRTAGDDVEIMLLGFEPDEQVRLDLYGKPALSYGKHEYRTSLTESAGPTGTRTVTIPTSRADTGTAWIVRVTTPDGGILDTTFYVLPPGGMNRLFADADARKRAGSG